MQTASNKNQTSQPAAANQPSQPSQAAKPLGALEEGEASGTIVDAGQTITLKYAYAGHGKVFNEDGVIFLLTEAPIAPEVVASTLEKEYGVFPDGNRGLEYKVGKGFWVMYHPSGFQTSGINTLKDYSLENGVVSPGRPDLSEGVGDSFGPCGVGHTSINGTRRGRIRHPRPSP